MSTPFQKSQKLLARITRAEKAQLLQWIVQDLGDDFPGIDTTPGIMGGAACLVHTRIPVWLLEQTRRAGSTDSDLRLAYPTLRAEDLANSWGYVRAHKAEIDLSITENEAA